MLSPANSSPLNVNILLSEVTCVIELHMDFFVSLEMVEQNISNCSPLNVCIVTGFAYMLIVVLKLDGTTSIVLI